MGLAEVSTVLWTERELLELLLFKLEEEQLVLASARTRWLAHATREVEMVIEQIRSAELSRAVAVDELAAELGLQPGPSLTALADAAPSPWDEMLRDHRKAFLALTDEISQMLALQPRAARAGCPDQPRGADGRRGPRGPDVHPARDQDHADGLDARHRQGTVRRDQ